MYGPIFDMATFFAGSLFAVYVLALSRMEGFIGRIFDTKTFGMFNGYVARSIILCVIVSGWSAYHLIFGASDLSAFNGMFVFCLWGATSAFALASVVRVVVLFLVLVSVDRTLPLGKRAGESP